jgi:hypothetical protein
VEELAEGYRTIVYPMYVTIAALLTTRFPLFHWPSFMNDVKARRYTHDRAFYIVTMTVCAIVSARLRDGAKLSTTLPANLGPSENYNRLAVDAFPPLIEARCFNYKRGKALLAVLCVQYGDIANLETHLGDYLTLSMNEGFYDESRWPRGLSEPEIQERRRLVSQSLCTAKSSSGRHTPWRSSQQSRGEASFDIAKPSVMSNTQQKSSMIKTLPILAVSSHLTLPRNRSYMDGTLRPICTESWSILWIDSELGASLEGPFSQP